MREKKTIKPDSPQTCDKKYQTRSSNMRGKEKGKLANQIPKM
jgi:hypothetical protein